MDEGLIKDIVSILDSDELVINNDKDINLSVDYPCLIFSRDDLVRVINLVNKLVLVKSDVSDYNSISFIPVSFLKTINLCATNELSHFKFSTEMLGDTNNSISISFSISLILLQKIVKFMGNKVLIYKNTKNNCYYVRLLDGDLLIDVKPVNLDIICMPGVPSDKIAELRLSNIGNICNSILPILSNALSTDKKIYFTGNKAFFKSLSYYIESSINTPTMILSYRDVEFFSKLYKYYKDSCIQLFDISGTDIPRIMIKLGNIEYEYINSVYSNFNEIPNYMSEHIKEPVISVQYDKLYKIISLILSISNTKNLIRIKYDNNELHLILDESRGESNFNFSLNKLVGRLPNLNKDFYIRANILKKLLESFYTADDISIYINNNELLLQNKNIKAYTNQIWENKNDYEGDINDDN